MMNKADVPAGCWGAYTLLGDVVIKQIIVLITKYRRDLIPALCKIVYMDFLIPHYNPVMFILVLFLFYKCGNRSMED